jgi:hypothetical protein
MLGRAEALWIRQLDVPSADPTRVLIRVTAFGLDAPSS